MGQWPGLVVHGGSAVMQAGGEIGGSTDDVVARDGGGMGKHGDGRPADDGQEEAVGDAAGLAEAWGGGGSEGGLGRERSTGKVVSK